LSGKRRPVVGTCPAHIVEPGELVADEVVIGDASLSGRILAVETI